MADFEHDLLIDVWTHPDSGVVILGEDMPHELMPWCRDNTCGLTTGRQTP